MRRTLFRAAAVLLLLAAGAAALFFALRPDGSPWEQTALRLVRAVNDRDDAALRDCMLIPHLLPEDQTAYGYPAGVTLAVPDAQSFWEEWEEELTSAVTSPATLSFNFVIPEASSSRAAFEATLNGVETAGYISEKVPETGHPTYVITLYLRMSWTDQNGDTFTELIKSDGLRAVEYRGNWYITDR